MRFFVYGTLKKGKHNNYIMGDANLLGTAETAPVYSLVGGSGFPIIERGGETSVKGEVFETEDEEIISRIFRLEGCSREQHNPQSWYDYDKIETPFGEAVIFVMDKGKSGRRQDFLLKSGVWID